MAAQPKPSHRTVIAAMATQSPDPWSVPVRAAAPHDSERGDRGAGRDDQGPRQPDQAGEDPSDADAGDPAGDGEGDESRLAARRDEPGQQGHGAHRRESGRPQASRSDSAASPCPGRTGRRWRRSATWERARRRSVRVRGEPGSPRRPPPPRWRSSRRTPTRPTPRRRSTGFDQRRQRTKRPCGGPVATSRDRYTDAHRRPPNRTQGPLPRSSPSGPDGACPAFVGRCDGERCYWCEVVERVSRTRRPGRTCQWRRRPSQPPGSTGRGRRLRSTGGCSPGCAWPGWIGR